MPTAYSYVRMSTPEQLKGDSLRRQLEKSRRVAKEHGWHLDESLRDLGLSAFTGENRERGALGQFIAKVKAKEVEPGSILLVESLDRLSREQVTDALEQFLALTNAGIIIVTLEDESRPEVYSKESMSRDWTRLIISIVAMARAYNESSTKGIRVKEAWQKKRDNAAKSPMTAACPAWLRLNDGKFEVIEERAAIIRKIFKDCSDGIGQTRIVADLNRAGIPAFRGDGWHRSYVQKLLEGEAVIGRYQPHRLIAKDGRKRREPIGDVIEGYYPPIVDLDVYEAARIARTNRRSSGGRKGRTYSNIFTGLCRCEQCGGTMEFVDKGPKPKGGAYLQCARARRGHKCTHRQCYRYDEIERSFLEHVHHFDFSAIMGAANNQLRDVRERIAYLQIKANDLTRKCQNLALEQEESPNRFLVDRLNSLTSELDKTEEELKGERARELIIKGRASSAQKDEIEDIRKRMVEANGDELFVIRSQLASMVRSFTAQINFDDGIVTVSVMVGEKTYGYRFANGLLIGSVQSIW